MSTNTPKSKPTVFISHKHVDREIADAIRSFISVYSGGRIAVFQSSSPWADAPKVGRNLNKQLRETLWKTTIVILVYTASDQDWNYCMWECGVASHPNSPETKIILFKCASSVPSVFGDQVNVNARDLVDIQKFTNEFLTAPDFFPNLGSPVTEFSPNGQEVASAAAALSQKLQPLLPPEAEEPSIEWPAYPFVQFELSLDDVEHICQAKAEKKIQAANSIIQQRCSISAADKYCEQLFGVPSFERDTSFGQLVDKWKAVYPNSQAKWIEALCCQIMAGALWEFPPVVWELMQGINDHRWYAPVLNRVRKIPTRKCMQFDIYFYKFDVDAGSSSVTLNIPGSELK